VIEKLLDALKDGSELLTEYRVLLDRIAALEKALKPFADAWSAAFDQLPEGPKRTADLNVKAREAVGGLTFYQAYFTLNEKEIKARRLAMTTGVEQGNQPLPRDD
jgi:hypothetical protein